MLMVVFGAGASYDSCPACPALGLDPKRERPPLASQLFDESEFECPTEHVEALRAFIPKVDKLLMIGWRGAEQPFLQLLAENLTQEVQGGVVAGLPDDAQKTIENVKRANVKGNFYNVVGGFTEFVLNREVDELLKN